MNNYLIFALEPISISLSNAEKSKCSEIHMARVRCSYSYV